MKKIGIIVSAFFVFGIASAQTDTVRKALTRDDVINARKNPDGTVKTTKTHQGTTKPNTNAIKNNTTGSPDPVRKPTDTTATPSGTMGPDRSRGGNTTKSPSTNTGTTTPRT